MAFWAFFCVSSFFWFVASPALPEGVSSWVGAFFRDPGPPTGLSFGWELPLPWVERIGPSRLWLPLGCVEKTQGDGAYVSNGV